jgi:hypothetical protein
LDLTIDDFFRGRDDSRRLFDAISREVDRLGDATVRVSKSQVAFRRKKDFAVVLTRKSVIGCRLPGNRPGDDPAGTERAAMRKPSMSRATRLSSALPSPAS